MSPTSPPNRAVHVVFSSRLERITTHPCLNTSHRHLWHLPTVMFLYLHPSQPLKHSPKKDAAQHRVCATKTYVGVNSGPSHQNALQSATDLWNSGHLSASHSDSITLLLHWSVPTEPRQYCPQYLNQTSKQQPLVSGSLNIYTCT